MEAEKKKRNMKGEGWHLMVVSEDGKTFSAADGVYGSATAAERALKLSALDYNGQTVAIVKIQKRVTVEVETKPVVRFS